MITASAPLHMNLLGALLILVFGFLFSTVSSRLTGYEVLTLSAGSPPLPSFVTATKT